MLLLVAGVAPYTYLVSWKGQQVLYSKAVRGEIAPKTFLGELRYTIAKTVFLQKRMWPYLNRRGYSDTACIQLPSCRNRPCTWSRSFQCTLAYTHTDPSWHRNCSPGIWKDISTIYILGKRHVLGGGMRFSLNKLLFSSEMRGPPFGRLETKCLNSQLLSLTHGNL